jgi:hypothetical protein
MRHIFKFHFDFFTHLGVKPRLEFIIGHRCDLSVRLTTAVQLVVNLVLIDVSFELFEF